ncbi:MAG: hypothetical protein HQL16_07585 [Candidatus Omnitrophica bacterium]|nr:hypothetical protein [Candidatus Omnitrophota bacterium]
MSQTKKTPKKRPSGKKPVKVSQPKAVEVKVLSSPHIKKAVSRIKKVRALQQGFAEVMSSKVAKLENNPVIKHVAPVAIKHPSLKAGFSRKGFINKVCFEAGALFGDASAFLKSGKTE